MSASASGGQEALEGKLRSKYEGGPNPPYFKLQDTFTPQMKSPQSQSSTNRSLENGKPNDIGGMSYPNLTDEQKLFIATVAGEAGGSSEAAQRAVAHVIMNRVGYKDWAKRDTVGKNLTSDQFSSINDPDNQPFQEITEYLKRRDASNPRLEKMINTAMNIYDKKEPDFTDGAVLFYSPKAQAELHKIDPVNYSKPHPVDWNFNELKHLAVPGTEDDDFLFYKYR